MSVDFYVSGERDKERIYHRECGFNDVTCVNKTYEEYPINRNKDCWKDPKHDAIEWSPPEGASNANWIGAGFGATFLCCAFIGMIYFGCLKGECCKNSDQSDGDEIVIETNDVIVLDRPRSDDNKSVDEIEIVGVGGCYDDGEMDLPE